MKRAVVDPLPGTTSRVPVPVVCGAKVQLNDASSNGCPLRVALAVNSTVPFWDSGLGEAGLTRISKSDPAGRNLSTKSVDASHKTSLAEFLTSTLTNFGED